MKKNSNVFYVKRKIMLYEMKNKNEKFENFEKKKIEFLFLLRLFIDENNEFENSLRQMFLFRINYSIDKRFCFVFVFYLRSKYY